jgi:hypothetical protein
MMSRCSDRSSRPKAIIPPSKLISERLSSSGQLRLNFFLCALERVSCDSKSMLAGRPGAGPAQTEEASSSLAPAYIHVAQWRMWL